MTTQKAKLGFGNGVDVSRVNPKTVMFLEEMGTASGNYNLRISSLTRTPFDQARIMYDNCSKIGVTIQYKLYGPNGDKVIAVYEAEKKKGNTSRTDIIEKMHNPALPPKSCPSFSRRPWCGQ